jgi:N-acetylneuraminate synthase/N,N'-diacetyllegionaminate synthase
MLIGDHDISRSPFIIAEAGLNHNGSVPLALEMVGVAAKAGCTAIKFQTFKAAGVCDESQSYTYRSQGREITEPRINLFRRAELPESAWPLLKAECARLGIQFLSTPQNPSDLDTLLKVGVPAIKIGSDDLTNLTMLRYCSVTASGIPLILSCGMSDLAEVYTALDVIGAFEGREVALLVCTSLYPCPVDQANLARITALKAALPGIPIGFSDHTAGTLAAAVACALGACVFEKHMTLGHNLAGPDHEFSADPVTLTKWVWTIKKAYAALGNGLVRPTKEERRNKEKYQRQGVRA